MKTIVEDNRCEILWRASETGNLVEVSELLRDGVDVDAANVYGTTALIRAVAAGRKQIVSHLLEHGANPNGARKDGFTPLLLAAFFGRADIVKNLIEYGANTEATTRFGTSAQMWASARTFQDVVDYLQEPHDASRVVNTARQRQPLIGDASPEPLTNADINSLDEVTIVQRPMFDRRLTALASVISAALLLAGAGVTSIKLRPNASTNAKTVQVVAAPERVQTKEQPPPAPTAVAQPPEKKPDNNHHSPQTPTRPSERKSTSARIPDVTVLRASSVDSEPAETTSQSADIQPLSIAPVEVKKTFKNATSSPSMPPPVNNSQLISPRGSSKSGKVIPWP